ncbi:hypothetical protein SKAU_G00032830 [Synaphobranchus kaupii]|uniref:Uncharacterized protein n=1 Tax=Synaphobranchus kaupii TaxID=118154 RepID=A0A9Q1GE59_SYNKA|nr:hypothetical protein SKAU_G00032830 [Synaphobranchus kaupii]
MQQLRESLSLLELEFIEFRENTRTSTTERGLEEQLREELHQLRQEHTAALKHLQEETYHSHSTLPSHTGPPKHTAPPRPTATPSTDTAFLSDSNEKHVDMRRMFPGRRVCKLWCPMTKSAPQLPSDSTLGNPGTIIIHTGTNDLASQWEGVAL